MAGNEDAPRDVVVRRQRVVIAVASAAALLSSAGLGASLFIKSPQQRAAEVAPPPPSVITAPVREDVLVNQVVVRGTVEADRVLDVLAPASTGQAQIVTQIRKRVGAKVSAGDVLVQVAGRPVFALPGRVPAYRPMHPGDSGSDVRQLQQSLADLGYLPADSVGGNFGSATREAVSDLYADNGFEPAHTWDDNPAQPSEIEGVEQEVVLANRKVEEDEETFEDASTTQERRRALRELTYSRTDRTRVEERLEELRASAGVQVPFGEVVFVPQLPARVVEVSTSVGSNLATADSARVMRLSTSALVARGVVPEGSQVGIRPGASAQLRDEVGARSAEGKAVTIGRFRQAKKAPSQGSEVSPGYPITVRPAKALSADWLGVSVRITLTVGRTEGEVLIVPVAAVLTSPDGATTVSVLEQSGPRQVRVTTGLVAAGEVAVTPEPGQSLTAADQVVVG